MKVSNIEEALQARPFQPFKLEIGERKFHVLHEDFVFITPGKGTAVIVDPNDPDRVAILDVGKISAICFHKK